MIVAPIPLYLDTDIGGDVDDVFALLLAARQPALDLLGVTVVYGAVEERARVARKLLDLAGRPDVPVAIGEALDGHDPGRGMTSAHGFVARQGASSETADEWDSLGARLHLRPAAEFLIERVLAAAEPPVLAAVGPLTNVAAALRRAPELARRLRALVLMGGRLDEQAARGEYNFNSDPEATRTVLESGAPLRIATYEVTCHARIGYGEAARLRAKGDPALVAAADQLELYLRRLNRELTSMYDPLSLTMAYTGRFLTTRAVRLAVACGERRTQLSIEPDGPPTAKVTVACDAPGFLAHLVQSIGVQHHSFAAGGGFPSPLGETQGEGGGPRGAR